MTPVETVTRFLDRLAPPELAESWDNVGLLVGDAAQEVEQVMTCLTITGETVSEAIEQGVQLIVTHHPLPFRPLKQLTRSTPEGRYLLDLIASGVAIYSAHTAFDSAVKGINCRLAEGLGLISNRPLLPNETASSMEGVRQMEGEIGAGRFGQLSPPATLGELLQRAKIFLNVDKLRYVGHEGRELANVAVACGSAGEFLGPAREQGCDCLVTGETSFHTCLEAEATDTALVLLGHFASERFAMGELADVLAAEFDGLTVWASRRERDPIDWSL